MIRIRKLQIKVLKNNLVQGKVDEILSNLTSIGFNAISIRGATVHCVGRKFQGLDLPAVIIVEILVVVRNVNAHLDGLDADAGHVVIIALVVESKRMNCRVPCKRLGIRVVFKVVAAVVGISSRQNSRGPKGIQDKNCRLRIQKQVA